LLATRASYLLPFLARISNLPEDRPMPLEPPLGPDPPAEHDSGSHTSPEATTFPPEHVQPPETLAGLTAERSGPPRGGYAASAPAIAGYEILKELGRGGMGVVYKARHLRLKRLVALKVILAGGHAGAAEFARFRVEAEAVARLQHPNVVQVFDVGEQEGLPFLAMELVEGGSLAERVVDTPLPSAEAAALVRTLAGALQAAHEAKVVHRDLKPANVLLTSDGMPKVSDFGLAKKLDDAGETATGAVLGTPSYMAPEQASGNAKEVGPAADVWALGAILYKLLTRRPPFQAATTMDTILQVLEDEPVSLRRLNSRVPRDLETVCLKCLEKDQARRYHSAGALAEDLRRFLDGKPVVARPVGRLARGWRWCERNRAVAALLAAVVLVTLTGLVSFAWAYGVAARRLADVEEANRRRVRAQVEELRSAAAPAVPDLLRTLDAQYTEALPHLRALWAEGKNKPGRMRFALALLPGDPSLRDDVAAAMLAADDPREMLLLLDGLKPFAADLKECLWQRASDKSTAAVARFRALVALAALDPADARWKEASPLAVEQLLQANSLYLGDWSKALRPASAGRRIPRQGAGRQAQGRGGGAGRLRPRRPRGPGQPGCRFRPGAVRPADTALGAAS
jgi:Protein kinase domain